MFCGKCRAENLTGAKFCKKCGQKLNETGRGPKRCSRGHIMEHSWNTCSICEASNEAYENAAVQVQHTIMEENSIANAQERPASATDRFNKLSNNPSSVGGVPHPQPQKHLKTMIQDESGALESPAQDQERKLVGFLVTYSHRPAGEYFALYNTSLYTLGRATNADISFIQDSLMSESHALLRYTGEYFQYQDNMSTNGSYVNGKRTDHRIALNNYDNIKMGNTEVILIMIEKGRKED